jgi:hypothetical protein
MLFLGTPTVARLALVQVDMRVILVELNPGKPLHCLWGRQKVGLGLNRVDLSNRIEIFGYAPSLLETGPASSSMILV